MPQEAPKEMTVPEFLDSLASGSATPGGGSAAALAGSMAAALVEMVANLTLGKKGFEGHELALRKMLEEANSYRQSLLSTIVQDITAYQEVIKAYLLPKTNEEEKRKRQEEIQKALKKAADPPLFTAATSLKVLKLCQQAIEKGKTQTITDAAVGALLAEAALWGGSLNVLINLSALTDKKYVQKMKKDLQRLHQEGEKIKQQIMAKVNEQLTKS
jgi:formiminotetrahydrofolate cyclodeaminase